MLNPEYELPQELPHNLMILKRHEILQKFYCWVESKPRADPLFSRENVGNSGHKLRKSIYQSFLVLSNIALILDLIPKILSGIADHSNPNYSELNKLTWWYVAFVFSSSSFTRIYSSYFCFCRNKIKPARISDGTKSS